ncbi:programmed cell death protein 1-like [Hoplias malabaricus]|uniref:programmed cell death protein 1-like n=1 Tax=Hoplias malabaricus TaxID=27720 RepID=UPI0034635B16
MEVEEDPRFGQTQTHTAHPGENLTFTCTYPDKYKDLMKFLHRETNHSLSAVIHPRQDPAQRGRFLFSDYSQKKHFTVSIRDMMKEDGGVYLCGVQEQVGGPTVFSFFSEIQLHVTDPAEKPSDSMIIIIIITACLGGTLLLIGGLTLIYKLRQYKTQNSASSLARRNTVNSDEVNHIPFYEEIPDKMTTGVYVPTQKAKFDRNTPPPDFYSMAERAPETATVYATVNHPIHPI